MKVLIIKLGSRISITSSGTSGGTGETLSIIKMLTSVGVDVTVYTKILDKDIMPNDFKILDIEDNFKKLDYDCLLILNGNVNYFGGEDSPSQTLNYYVINHFKGKVFYILCDCNLLLTQIWPSIEKKYWANQYKKEDINITRSDIVYLTQAMETDKVLKKARDRGINIKSCIYYPFEKFPLLTMNYYKFNEHPKYDLLYGGTFRSGRREVDMLKYYFGYSDDYVVEMFGKIKLDNFKKYDGVSKPPIFGKSVSYDEFGNKMHESKATVIIGDPLYKEWGDLAQRIYESIMVGNVVLLDLSYDFTKRVFSNPELKEFNYVTCREDVENRLSKLKNRDFRKYIIDLQIKDTKISLNKYCKEFVKLLED